MLLFMRNLRVLRLKRTVVAGVLWIALFCGNIGAETWLYVEPLRDPLPVSITGSQDVEPFIRDVVVPAMRKSGEYDANSPWASISPIITIDIRQSGSHTYSVVFTNGEVDHWRREIVIDSRVRPSELYESGIAHLVEAMSGIVLHAVHEPYSDFFVFRQKEYYDVDALAEAILRESDLDAAVYFEVGSYIRAPKVTFGHRLARAALCMVIGGYFVFFWDGPPSNQRAREVLGVSLMGSGIGIGIAALIVQKRHPPPSLVPAIASYNDWYFEQVIFPILEGKR